MFKKPGSGARFYIYMGKASRRQILEGDSGEGAERARVLWQPSWSASACYEGGCVMVQPVLGAQLQPCACAGRKQAWRPAASERDAVCTRASAPQSAHESGYPGAGEGIIGGEA